MDNYSPRFEFYTPKKEYKIAIYKEKKNYSISEFGKYDCHIDFYDTVLNRLVLSIVSTEKDFLNMYTLITEFIEYLMYDCMSIIGTTVALNSSYFFNLGVYVVENPVDDDEFDFGLVFNLYQRDMSGNVLRISFNCNIDFVEQWLLPAVLDIVRTTDNYELLYQNYIQDTKYII